MIEFLIALTLAGLSAAAAPVSEPVPDNPCPEGWQYVMSEVRRGERTVPAVAARLRVDPEMLAAWNGLSTGAHLQDGQAIFLCRDQRPGSVGFPWRGRLRGGVNIDANGDGRGCGWVKAPERVHTWGTPETVAAVSDCLCRYRIQYPDAPDISLGDISRQSGRRLSRHVSHQSGRDVDIGYVTTPPQTNGRFNRRATMASLDVARQWSIVKCFLDRGNVQYMFMGWQAISALRRHVESIPGERDYLRYFPRGSQPVLNPDQGHRDHIHIRFACPENDGECGDRR